MNQVLSWTWKEWRAQRGLLVAYTLMVFGCLCLGLFLAPRHQWFDEDFGVHALSWFVAAGVIGVVAFVVPGLVRGEFVGQKGDEFVRRLPGVLWAAFWGKLLFLVLAALMLPLLGLLFGELFLTALGHDWSGLFVWDWRGNVNIGAPQVVMICAAAMLMVPWIWAAGTWTPGGRLALLAAVLLALALGVGVFAVLRQSPQLLARFRWEPWLWYVPFSGLCAAMTSWSLGRRGGGPFRSARFGLLTTAVAALPWAGWLGEQAWRYHHPRTDRLEEMSVEGLTADGRFALVSVSERDEWFPVRVRIDLDTGEAAQVCGAHDVFTCELGGPSRMAMRATQRWWRTWSDDVSGLYDLETNRAVVVDYDWRERRFVDLAPELRAELLEQRRADAFLQAPGGVRVWYEPGALCFDTAGGVERVPLELRGGVAMYPSGHAVRVFAGGESRHYDLVRREWIADGKRMSQVWQVGDVRVFSRLVQRSGQPRGWRIQAGEGPERACDELHDSHVLGLFDDEHLLVATRRRDGRPMHPFLFRPATGEVIDVPVECELGASAYFGYVSPMLRQTSLLPRDPRGRVWLRTSEEPRDRIVALGPGPDGVVRVTPLDLLTGADGWGRNQLLRWADYPKVLVRDGVDIVEVDVETGERVVKFEGNRAP